MDNSLKIKLFHDFSLKKNKTSNYYMIVNASQRQKRKLFDK